MITTLAGPPRERRGGRRTGAPAAADEPVCALDPERRELAVIDDGLVTLYGLGERPAGGIGWIAVYGERDGSAVMQWHKLSAAEPMAIARDLLGQAGEEQVARLTLAAAERLASRCEAKTGRLEREVADGLGLSVLAVRPLREAIVQAVEREEVSLCELGRRAGFFAASDKPDVSWLERLVGLRPEDCSRNRARRVTRRVIPYEQFVRLVWALGRDPVDLGA